MKFTKCQFSRPGFWQLLVAGVVLALMSGPGLMAQGYRGKGKYVGAKKCKNCHRSKKKGNQYGKWQKMKHAKAYENLASEEAIKLGKAQGVDNPQQSEKCLKCHTTAFGVEKKQIHKRFDSKLGVQCEACHGPGDKHAKARLMAAADMEEAQMGKRQKVPASEIHASPSVKVCKSCHNSEFPNFKGFCIKRQFSAISHMDPRKERSKEELDAMKCTCPDCKCKDSECGVPAALKE